MKLTIHRWSTAACWMVVCAAWILTSVAGNAQGVATTTVQGTVYLANGQPGSGTLQLSWPAFTTASNQAVTAGRINVVIAPDGYVSVSLAPNQGSTPAGLFYTAVYHLSDGTTSTEYWTVPSAAQASLSQVRAQVMPAAQAVQAVSKTYVDQTIAELTQSLLTASGGSLNGPLFLNGDPTQPKQAATKHYVDQEFGMAVPLTGATMSGPLTSIQLGAVYQADQFSGADFGAKLQACVNRLDAVYGGTCDARNFSGTQGMSAPVVIATANATVQLPCATIATASPIQITAGTRNVTLHGCALRGASGASGSQGGTVFLYSGTGPVIQIGDPTYATDTPGFHMDDAVINTTASTDAGAQGLAAYRTQEMDLESLYLLGNSNQTGITLDGTGNYTGGTFQDVELGGYGIGLNAIGHQVTNAATTDWLNASAFIRLHINCPTSGGSPVAGTYGINLLQGDGNTFTGGDVEGCATALHLGPNAQNNTIVGLRNENSTNQVVADAGSGYNSWMTGGTMFTGRLTDNGTRNSFLDTFHRSFNSLNGDWYGSQQDATVTNHFRVGTGAGNERGLLNRYQSDYGYRWTTGLSDAAAGEQFYQVLDELNNVYRLNIGQYNHGQSSTNNQTVINAAGTGAVVLNGSTNSGTGGVIFGAGGSSGATVATINNAGNAQFNGALQVSGPSTFTSTTTVKNQADGEIDSVLWAGSTANQKESFIYKDYLGASQWYMVKDTSNNWALNSATGGLDSFKAYQSNNSGDTYINASTATGHVRLNYETGSGSETDIYSGPNSALVAAFLGSTAIKFPGLAAANGHNCLQIDNSGYISNTGTACGAGGGGGTNGTVNSGSAGQLAYYDGNGTILSGMTSVAVNAGGTGATTASQALQNLGAQAAMAGVVSDGASGLTVGGNVAAVTTVSSVNSQINPKAAPYNATGSGATEDTAAIEGACDAARATSPPATISLPYGNYLVDDLTAHCAGVSFIGPPSGMGVSVGANSATLIGKPGKDVFHTPDPNNGGTAPNRSWSLENITIEVDDSLDPNHRNASDGVTNGTTAVTSATMNFAATDIGLYMTLVFPDGVRNVAKIAGVSNSTTATLSTIPTESHTGVSLYIPLSSPAFPHRWPGRWLQDASMTPGSSILTSANAVFTCGDVGQWVRVIGAGAGGSDVIAQIPSQTWCSAGAPGQDNSTTVDLGASNQAGTSVTNAYLYVSVNGLSPFERVGNAALAWDNFDGNPADWTMSGSKITSYPVLRNVSIHSLSGTNKNHSAGIFNQGTWGLYGLDAQQVNLTRLDFGVVEAVQDTNLRNGSHLTFGPVGSDYQTWRHVYDTATNPWISYNNADVHIEDWQLASANGFAILSMVSGVESGAADWDINIPEFEMNVNAPTHISGDGLRLHKTQLGRHAYLDGSNIHCDSCAISGSSNPDMTLEVSGNHNDILLRGALDKLASVATNGPGNRVEGTTAAGYPAGPRLSMLSGTRTEITGDKRADFLRSNPTTPFNNMGDLWLWPQDVHCHSIAPNIVSDPTVESGYYLQSPGTYGCLEDFWYTLKLPNVGVPNGLPVIGGPHAVLGASKYQWVAKVSCPSITSFTPTVSIVPVAGGSAVATLNMVTQTCSPGYTTIKSTVDLSSYGGGVNFIEPNWPGAGEIHIAWEGWRPFAEDYNGYQPENAANKNQPNGYAGLDGSGNLAQPAPTAARLSTHGTALQVWQTGPDGVTQQWAAIAGSGLNTLGCLDGYDHVPCVVARVAPATYTSSTGYATVFTPSVAGQYRLCGNLVVTAAGTAGSGQFLAKFVSQGNTVQNFGLGVTGYTLGNSSAASSSRECVMLAPDVGTAIQWRLSSVPTGTGTPAVYGGITLELVSN